MVYIICYNYARLCYARCYALLYYAHTHTSHRPAAAGRRGRARVRAPPGPARGVPAGQPKWEPQMRRVGRRFGLGFCGKSRSLSLYIQAVRLIIFMSERCRNVMPLVCCFCL